MYNVIYTQVVNHVLATTIAKMDHTMLSEHLVGTLNTQSISFYPYLVQITEAVLAQHKYSTHTHTHTHTSYQAAKTTNKHYNL